MASGDDIEAGRTTTGYSTTFLIAEIPELGSRTGFNGDAVLHVRSQGLPLLEPRTAVNGIVAAGHRGGRGITGFGGVPGGTGVVALGAEGAEPRQAAQPRPGSASWQPGAVPPGHGRPPPI